jgi:hypothetical protein
MTDEHLMRQWAAAHSEFTSDLDRGLQRLGRFFTARLQGGRPIGKTYVAASCTTAPTEQPSSAIARAALAGVIACIATTGLLLTVALLATADMHPAAAYPIITNTIVA